MKLVNPTLLSGNSTALLVAVLALLGPGKLGAQTVVSNLTETPSLSFYAVGWSTNLRQIAFSFTTGAVAADFTGVSLIFGANKAGSPGPLTFGLYATTFNTSNGTGSLLTTLTTSGDPLVAGTYSFTVPAGPVTLAAGTTYYLRLSADGAPSSSNYFDLRYTTSTAEISLTGWTIGDLIYTYSGGSLLSSVAQPPRFSVQATEVGAVPEPSTYAMFAGLGVLGFAAWRRRKSVSA